MKGAYIIFITLKKTLVKLYRYRFKLDDSQTDLIFRFIGLTLFTQPVRSSNIDVMWCSIRCVFKLYSRPTSTIVLKQVIFITTNLGNKNI